MLFIQNSPSFQTDRSMPEISLQFTLGLFGPSRKNANLLKR